MCKTKNYLKCKECNFIRFTTQNLWDGRCPNCGESEISKSVTETEFNKQQEVELPKYIENDSSLKRLIGSGAVAVN